MSKRNIKNDKKLALLERINERKSILFSKFSGKCGNAEKEKEWKKVHEFAQSLGLAGRDRLWTFTRDNLFGLWKSRTLAKRDNSRKTGSSGGKEKMMDEVDTSILNIIETESPILDGLDILESDGTGNPGFGRSKSPFVSDIAPTLFTEENTDTIDSNEGNHSQFRKRKRKIDPHKKKNEQENDEKDSLHELKRKLLEIEIYKNTLRAAKLEKELGLSPSKFTKIFFTKTVCDMAVTKILDYSDTESES